MDQVAPLVDRLYGIFSPIYAKWVEWTPVELYAWKDSQGKSALQILETDIRIIGEYFATMDGIGARPEYTLTAECLAKLRFLSQGIVPNRNALEQEIDKACRQIEHERKSYHVRFQSGDSKIPFETPLSWRIAQQVASNGRCSPEALNVLYDVFHDMAHLFLLRDGNITPEEDEGWNQFHAAFSR
jgi:hypothetical protein